jgi:hypothetical protein
MALRCQHAGRYFNRRRRCSRAASTTPIAARFAAYFANWLGEWHGQRMSLFLRCYNPLEEGVLTMTNIGRVVKLLQSEHDRLTKQVKGIAAALKAFGASFGSQNGARKISAAGRARIAAAQRARWAKAGNNRGIKITKPKKRGMSAAAKKRIAEAQKKRWAAQKAMKAAKS